MQKFTALLFAAMPLVAGTITNAEISGFGTTIVSGSADAYYSGGLGSSDPPAISANMDAFGSTDGPVRAGFLEVTGLGDGEDAGNAILTIGSYTFECGFTCLPSLAGTPLPFTLGVPFEVNVSASAGTLGDGVVTGSGVINFQFSLFESFTPEGGFPAFPGMSVIIDDPPAAVPEPTAFAVVGLLLLWLGKKHIRRFVSRL